MDLHPYNTERYDITCHNNSKFSLFFLLKWQKNSEKKRFSIHISIVAQRSLLCSLWYYVAITFFKVANRVLYTCGRPEEGGHIAVLCCENKLFHFCKVCISICEVGKVAPKASVSNVEMLWHFPQVVCIKLVNWISVLKWTVLCKYHKWHQTLDSFHSGF
jgi:hypothetical protein